MTISTLTNPFRPGAGHMPPYLAGRDKEIEEFKDLLRQQVVVNNLILTGLRGVGKTVLLDTFRPLAIDSKWLWAGTDLSESVSINEETIVIRLLTDLSALTSSFVIKSEVQTPFGFNTSQKILNHYLDYETLNNIYASIPGLASDKLKILLELVWSCIKQEDFHGIVFAYDEAQTISDHSEKEQYPLSLLLDVFQSVQRKNIPFLLVLTGLPTLFPKLVETRTFTERMFTVMFLSRLEKKDSEQAILKPIQKAGCPVRFTKNAIEEIIQSSGGYPYFIQFLCKEAFDMYLQQLNISDTPYIDYRKAIEEITRKLDNDFFAGRWARVTDRQRELLQVIAALPDSDEEFSVQEVVESAKSLPKPFSASHVNQILSALTNSGLVYKNRHGRYSFAVPLLGQYIHRQQKEAIRKKGQLELFPKL